MKAMYSCVAAVVMFAAASAFGQSAGEVYASNQTAVAVTLNVTEYTDANGVAQDGNWTWQFTPHEKQNYLELDGRPLVVQEIHATLKTLDGDKSLVWHTPAGGDRINIEIIPAYLAKGSGPISFVNDTQQLVRYIPDAWYDEQNVRHPLAHREFDVPVDKIATVTLEDVTLQASRFDYILETADGAYGWNSSYAGGGTMEIHLTDAMIATNKQKAAAAKAKAIEQLLNTVGADTLDDSVVNSAIDSAFPAFSDSQKNGLSQLITMAWNGRFASADDLQQLKTVADAAGVLPTRDFNDNRTTALLSFVSDFANQRAQKLAEAGK